MFRDELAALDDVTAETVQPLFKKIQKGLKVKGKFVYMPIRVAVTGVMHGPDLNVIVASWDGTRSSAGSMPAVSLLTKCRDGDL